MDPPATLRPKMNHAPKVRQTDIGGKVGRGLKQRSAAR
jgi:hypothetical protein